VRRPLLLSLPFLFCWFTSVAAQTAIHILELRHRTAHEMIALVQPLLRHGESVAGTGYQLILNTSETRRHELEKLVRALDVDQRQLTITVRQAPHRDDAETRIGADGTIVIGKNGGSDVRLHGRQRETTTNRQQTQTLRVLDGHAAFIRTGQSLPTIRRILQLTGRGEIAVQERLQVHHFTSGFDVLPRVRGDSVLLEITPRLAGMPQGVADRFRFQELSTTVSARFGQWVDLGAIANQSSQVSREILGYSRNESNERASVYVKVDPQ
jgi:hypothetical protein